MSGTPVSSPATPTRRPRWPGSTGFYRTFHEERAAQWAQHGTDWPGHWRDALGSGDDGVLVTASQARELRAEIEAVIRRYHHAGAGDPDALRVLVYTDLFPFDATPP